MSGWQFPQWSYGYTQMPPGGYNYHGYPGFHPPPPPRPPPPYTAGRGRGTRPPAPPPTSSHPTPPTPSEGAVIKAEPVIQNKSGEAGPSTAVKTEEGEIVEKSVLGILNGRNAVMFCNGEQKSDISVITCHYFYRSEQAPGASHGMGAGQSGSSIIFFKFCLDQRDRSPP